jgi:sodium transport system permease protein
VSIATVTLTLIVALIALRLPRLQAIDLPIGLSAREAMLMWSILVPLALCAAAVQILVALRARSYKEAQTQMSLLIFLPMVPGFLLAFGSIEADLWVRLTPMTGHHVLIGDVVRGIAPATIQIAVLTLVTCGATAMALWHATALLGRERIVRRLGE